LTERAEQRDRLSRRAARRLAVEPVGKLTVSRHGGDVEMIELICIDHGTIDCVSVELLALAAETCPYCGAGLWQRDVVVQDH
jgi:hypothetical protein